MVSYTIQHRPILLMKRVWRQQTSTAATECLRWISNLYIHIGMCINIAITMCLNFSISAFRNRLKKIEHFFWQILKRAIHSWWNQAKQRKSVNCYILLKETEAKSLSLCFKNKICHQIQAQSQCVCAITSGQVN